MLKLTLLFCFVSLLSFAEISTDQKAALIDLYNSTNGKSWNRTWNLEKPVSTWSGVKIEDSSVVELNLSFNKLEGTLPESISKLSSLKVLDLSFNKLEGE